MDVGKMTHRVTAGIHRVRLFGSISDRRCDMSAHRYMQQQQPGAAECEYEEGHQKWLRAAHDVVLSAEPDRVDVDTEICILRA